MILPWKKFARPLALGTVAILLTSCSTQLYSGSRRDKEQVARLRENSKQFMSAYFVTLWEVNGQRVHDSTFGLDVAPGRTNVTVLVHSPPSRGNPVGYRKVNRSLTTKAGHEYIFDSAAGKLVVREQLNQNVVDKLKKEE